MTTMVQAVANTYRCPVCNHLTCQVNHTICRTDPLKLSRNRWSWSGFRLMYLSASFSFCSGIVDRFDLIRDSSVGSLFYSGTVQWLQMFRAVNVNGEILGGAWLATKTVIANNFANILRLFFQEKLKAVTGDWFKDVQKELPPSPRRIIEEKIKILEPTQRELNINDPEPNMKPSQTLTPSEPRPRMSVQHSNSHSSHQSQGAHNKRWTVSKTLTGRSTNWLWRPPTLRTEHFDYLWPPILHRTPILFLRIIQWSW